MRALLHYEELVRYLVLRDHWDVRSGDLHHLNLVKVCARVYHSHQSCYLTALILGRTTFRSTVVILVGRRCY